VIEDVNGTDASMHHHQSKPSTPAKRPNRASSTLLVEEESKTCIDPPPSAAVSDGSPAVGAPPPETAPRVSSLPRPSFIPYAFAIVASVAQTLTRGCPAGGRKEPRRWPHRPGTDTSRVPSCRSTHSHKRPRPPHTRPTICFPFQSQVRLWEMRPATCLALTLTVFSLHAQSSASGDLNLVRSA
jgi:hypothetical protein